MNRKKISKSSMNSVKHKMLRAAAEKKEDLLQLSQIQISGNKEVLVEGYKELLEYDDNMIRIKTKCMEISFWGTKLVLRSLNTENVVVEGILERIEFV